MKQKIGQTKSLLCALALLLGLSACAPASTKEEETAAAQKEVATQFFEAFSQADYAAMQGLCTPACVEAYFHDGDVFGMVRAEAKTIHEPERTPQGDSRIQVDVGMETAETSALYGETETSFYLLLAQDEAGAWKVDGFVTG